MPADLPTEPLVVFDVARVKADEIAKALHACRAGAEASRAALLLEMQDLAQKLHDSEERAARLEERIAGRPAPFSDDALDEIERRGVHGSDAVAELDREALLRELRPRRRSLGVADALRLFVALEGTDRRFREALEDARREADDNLGELKAAHESEMESVKEGLRDEIRAGEKLLKERTADLDKAEEARDRALEDADAERRLRLNAEAKVAALEDAVGALQAKVGPIVKAWVEVVAPALRTPGGLDDLVGAPSDYALLDAALAVTPASPAQPKEGT